MSDQPVGALVSAVANNDLIDVRTERFKGRALARQYDCSLLLWTSRNASMA
jgi:hypothetical protein